MKHVYNDDSVGWTGPVFKGCTVNFGASRPPFCGHWIDVEFDSELLGDDALLSWHPGNALQLDSCTAPNQQANWSPMEVQFNNDTWISAFILSTSDLEHIDPAKVVEPGVLPAGYNKLSISAMSPVGGAASVTGIRWAWRDYPCCPQGNRDVVPCPPNSCTIKTVKSDLPAVPFMAKIVDGKCRCTPPMQC